MPYYPWFNGTTMVDFFKYPNAVTNNLFWPSMLLVMGMIMFVTFKGFGAESKDSFAATSFLLIPISVLFVALGFLQPQISLAPIILFIFTVIIVYGRGGN